jgi:hypothetical protein
VRPGPPRSWWWARPRAAVPRVTRTRAIFLPAWAPESLLPLARAADEAGVDELWLCGGLLPAVRGGGGERLPGGDHADRRRHRPDAGPADAGRRHPPAGGDHRGPGARGTPADRRRPPAGRPHRPPRRHRLRPGRHRAGRPTAVGRLPARPRSRPSLRRWGGCCAEVACSQPCSAAPVRAGDVAVAGATDRRGRRPGRRGGRRAAAGAG